MESLEEKTPTPTAKVYLREKETPKALLEFNKRHGLPTTRLQYRGDETATDPAPTESSKHSMILSR